MIAGTTVAGIGLPQLAMIWHSRSRPLVVPDLDNRPLVPSFGLASFLNPSVCDCIRLGAEIDPSADMLRGPGDTGLPGTPVSVNLRRIMSVRFLPLHYDPTAQSYTNYCPSVHSCPLPRKYRANIRLLRQPSAVPWMNLSPSEGKSAIASG